MLHFDFPFILWASCPDRKKSSIVWLVDQLSDFSLPLVLKYIQRDEEIEGDTLSVSPAGH